MVLFILFMVLLLVRDCNWRVAPVACLCKMTAICDCLKLLTCSCGIEGDTHLGAQVVVGTHADLQMATMISRTFQWNDSVWLNCK